MAAVKGFEAKVVSNAAVGLAAIPVTGCTKFLLTVEGVVATCVGVRMRGDGTNPTGALGHFLAVGQSFVFDFEPTNLKFIRDASASTDATLDIHYLGE